MEEIVVNHIIAYNYVCLALNNNCCVVFVIFQTAVGSLVASLRELIFQNSVWVLSSLRHTRVHYSVESLRCVEVRGNWVKFCLFLMLF